MNEYTITQLTDNNLEEIRADVSGGNVVWSANDGNDTEIFFYDGSNITQITDNEQFDSATYISGNNLAWYRSPTDPIANIDSGGEIVFYDGNTETVISSTDNTAFPVISGSNVVWGDGFLDGEEIFLYDGSNITSLTDAGEFSPVPNSISGNSVVWTSTANPQGVQIFLYDGNNTIQLTDSNSIKVGPLVSENRVAWTSLDPNDFGNFEVFFYDGNNTIQLTDNDSIDIATSISGNNVVWQGSDGNDNEIFLYDGNTTIQITDNDTEDVSPVVSGNNVVWQGNDGNDNEIFLYDGNTTTQITDNEINDITPTNDGDTIVWKGGEGNNTEIFLATRNTPTIDENNPPSTVYRFLNNDTGVHFYTANETEKNVVEQLANFSFEGASYQGVDPLTGAGEATLVYRFLNEDTGVHLYTIDETERDAVEELVNFSFEGEAFFAYATEVEGTIPIYRFFNSATGAHFYTPSAEERDNVANNLPDYQSEGIAYYALPIDLGAV